MYTSLEISDYLSQVLETTINENLDRYDLKKIIDGGKDLTIVPPYSTREDFEEMLAGLEIFRGYLMDLSKKRIDVGKIPVDRSKTHVSDLVDGMQFLQNFLANQRNALG